MTVVSYASRVRFLDAHTRKNKQYCVKKNVCWIEFALRPFEESRGAS